MVFQSYVINKTYLEMFDAFRAYGLSLILDDKDEESTIKIQDFGHAYRIFKEGSIPKEPSPELFVDDQGWKQIFGTYRQRKDSKKMHPKNEIEEILTHEYNEVLKIYNNPEFVPRIGRQVENGRTLYQSLDVSASKGYREGKRDVYNEGTQLQVDKYSWAIACLGAAYSGVWRHSESFILSLVPNPKDVALVSHRQIHKDLDLRVSTISTTTALAHYSIRLALLISERKLSQRVKYDDLIFNVMKKTGQQPKPGGGGRYKLTFLERLTATPSGNSALREIEKMFPVFKPKTNVKEKLALSLADFFLNPNLENFKTFESVYIRGQINGELYPWEKDHIGEILKYVEVV